MGWPGGVGADGASVGRVVWRAVGIFGVGQGDLHLGGDVEAGGAAPGGD